MKALSCPVAGCGEHISIWQVFCEKHWAALPGRDRSRISLSMRTKRGPVREQLIARAKDYLERLP